MICSSAITLPGFSRDPPWCISAEPKTTAIPTNTSYGNINSLSAVIGSKKMPSTEIHQNLLALFRMSEVTDILQFLASSCGVHWYIRMFLMFSHLPCWSDLSSEVVLCWAWMKGKALWAWLFWLHATTTVSGQIWNPSLRPIRTPLTLLLYRSQTYYFDNPESL